MEFNLNTATKTMNVIPMDVIPPSGGIKMFRESISVLKGFVQVAG